MTRVSRSRVRRLAFPALAVLLLLPVSARAQTRLSSANFRNGPAVRKAFREAVEAVNNATVSVLARGKQVALGAVVEPDGYIITKASRLKGLVECKLHDGRKLNAHIVGVSKDDDLALVKVDAHRLETVEWRTGDDPRLGNWLATPGMDATPVSVGVLSVARRRIPKPRPLLGVQIEDDKHGARIAEVNPNSGAQKAGLKAGDVITWIAGKVVKDRRSLAGRIQQFNTGDTLELKVLRNGKQLKFRAVLGSSLNPRSRGAIQNRMGGNLSVRRYGFPEVFQHDSYLKPNECGGPLVDLNGRVVGINIARAGRTESYAIPANRVQKLLPDLRSGKLAPPKFVPDRAPAPPLPGK